jgi:hypothetical protein
VAGNDDVQPDCLKGDEKKMTGTPAHWGQVYLYTALIVKLI